MTIGISLDGDDVASLFDDPDVEAHGMKLAIAIVVTSAAILAPAGQAAVTQSSVTAATTQRAARRSDHAGRSSRVDTATKADVTTQVQPRRPRSRRAMPRSFGAGHAAAGGGLLR